MAAVVAVPVVVDVAATAAVADVVAAAVTDGVGAAGTDLSTDLINGSNSDDPSLLSVTSDSLRSSDSSLLPSNCKTGQIPT